MPQSHVAQRERRLGQLLVTPIRITSVIWLAQISGVYAQEKVLPSVTVTAEPVVSQTLTPIGAARKRIETIPGGADIVDSEQYRQGRASTLADALQFSPGVFVASRFGAEEARVSIRGSGLQRTFHMRGIQLLQDGVPLNLADGSADFQAVEPLSARYVEVHRGANALQYGGTTLGGAINFISPSGWSAPVSSGRIEAGSFGYRRAQISAAGQRETVDWFVSGSTFQQDGFRAHSRQSTQRMSGNVGWEMTDALETRFFLNAVKSDSELPGALTRAEMRANARRADPAAVSGDQHRDFVLYRLSNMTALRLDAERRVEVGSFYSYKSLFHPIFQVLDQDSADVGMNLRYVSGTPLFGSRNQFTVGTQLSAGKLSDDRFRNLGGQPGNRTGQSEQHSRNYVVFAENQHYVRPTTALVVGVQAVEAKRRLDDRFDVDGDSSVERTYRRVLPKVGFHHAFTPHMQLYGNVSQSYEPPTFGELAGGVNVTPVNAQRAATTELGTRGLSKQDWGTVRWELSLYRAKVRNELLALNDASGNPLGTRNASQTLHQGAEAGIEAELGQHWTVRAAYQLNDFRFKADPVYRNNRLAGMPRHTAVAELLYRLENGVYFGPTIRAASATYVDHANSLQAAGYGVASFKIGQRMNRGMSWFVDARNLTNKTYAATTGVIADARSVDSRQFYPGEGRALYAGIEFKH